MNNDKGLKTEFIGYIISSLGLLIEMIKTDSELYGILVAIITSIYIICRTVYKKTKTEVDDKLVEHLNNLLEQIHKKQ
ncbi:MAG: hypothetical protein RMJ67_06440 [Elusimicrobiota bacterium]|nr:hypothetical protein [Endomicrobiia bacterium]MDW8166132.1 hypothetical protein [Elusimicrobiota bacterium]